jgi:GNAT superfamily N-acetyltransferase
MDANLDKENVTLTFREVNQDTWPDLEQLFESRGGPKYCWCIVWRVAPAERKQLNNSGRKADLKHRVDTAIPIGLVGYLDHEPVAWCSIAPRPTFLGLGGIEDSAEENVWSLTCFFVKRMLRRKGIIRQIISAAVAHATLKGATIVEAYPVDPESPSYRFMGYVESFKAAGFEEVGRAGSRRHVLRLRVG